ncbi:hypothetical protein BGZ95_003622 [Linnemannia exigua]|uniref:F-box/LRR-repeat protein 15-like leucin rich repeat domain-containing protein n=1 Tax=Linnemannia exigua TaxID=604196 RepID=A0AAD4H194_9FUNG|nr:hypothetical protein BGZ95_003622 [Linnemannia exigua]
MTNQRTPTSSSASASPSRKVKDKDKSKNRNKNDSRNSINNDNDKGQNEWQPPQQPKSPLAIEEVLYEILSRLDKHSLHSCVSVNRVFYRAAVRALWTTVQWKSSLANPSFLPEMLRYGHNAIELQDNFDADLDIIAEKCTRLRELRLVWTQATDPKLHNILVASPKISSLYLYNCKPLTTLALSHIQALSGLKKLELKNMLNVDEASIAGILRSCPLIEHLVLEDVRLGRVALDSLGITPLSIKTLALTRSSPTGSFVRNVLRNSPMLREFSLARNVHSALSVEDLLPEPDMYRYLINLNLESCKSIPSDALLSVLRLCVGLERINLCGTWIDDAALDVIASNSHKLTNLNLGWCAQITDAGLLRMLTVSRNLVFLDISSHGVLTAGIFRPDLMWACSRLQTLIMVGIDMMRPGGRAQINHGMMFDQLSRLSCLQDLAIGGPYLDLRLEAGLDKMGKLDNLESFRINHLQNALGEDEIRWLVEVWPKLKRLKVELAALSEPWRRYFRRRRPHLVLG